MRKFIITGGPCSGKTSLIKSFVDKRYSTLSETAREIINEESEKSQGKLPWTDVKEFQIKVMNRQKLKENELIGDIVFLDRGLPDNIAYCELNNIDLGESIIEDIKIANYEKVFIMDILPIYEKDEERKEDLEEAKKIHEKICEVYKILNFDIVKVPFLEINERKKYVLDRIN